MNAAWPRGRQWWLPAAGVLVLLACLWLGRGAPRQVLASYLFAFVFFTGLSVGSLALAMVHPLTGGGWGYFIRPQVLAAARTLPLMAVLALPVLLGMHALYDWSPPGAATHDALLLRQSWYLNPAFFVIRTLVCFGLWLLWLALFTRALRRGRPLAGIAASGLVMFALTTLVTSTDWLSSLMPHWHSTAFGMLVATGWMLAAAALAIAATLAHLAPGDTRHAALLQDLGSLLLMFVLGWAYLAFMQYLTIWIADLPTENGWYIPRTLTSWRALAWLLVAFHFAVPFLVLLSRQARRSRRWLGAMATMLLVAHLADAWWLVVPGLRPAGLTLHPVDALAPLGIGALWLCVYQGQARLTLLEAESAHG